MRAWVLVGVIAAGLSGCAKVAMWPSTGKATDGEVVEETVRADILPDGTVRPVARPMQGATGGGNAVLGAKVVPPKGALGGTVVSLGSPAEPGFWLKTPLVAVPVDGRISHGGKTVDVQLIPINGKASAGSRLSLKAMQALGIPLTELTKVQVSAI